VADPGVRPDNKAEFGNPAIVVPRRAAMFPDHVCPMEPPFPAVAAVACAPEPTSRCHGQRTIFDNVCVSSAAPATADTHKFDLSPLNSRT
jgi:hypothetical protein